MLARPWTPLPPNPFVPDPRPLPARSATFRASLAPRLVATPELALVGVSGRF